MNFIHKSSQGWECSTGTTPFRFHKLANEVEPRRPHPDNIVSISSATTFTQAPFPYSSERSITEPLMKLFTDVSVIYHSHDDMGHTPPVTEPHWLINLFNAATVFTLMQLNLPSFDTLLRTVTVHFRNGGTAVKTRHWLLSLGCITIGLTVMILTTTTRRRIIITIIIIILINWHFKYAKITVRSCHKDECGELSQAER